MTGIVIVRALVHGVVARPTAAAMTAPPPMQRKAVSSIITVRPIAAALAVRTVLPLAMLRLVLGLLREGR